MFPVSVLIFLCEGLWAVCVYERCFINKDELSYETLNIWVYWALSLCMGLTIPMHPRLEGAETLVEEDAGRDIETSVSPLCAMF